MLDDALSLMKIFKSVYLNDVECIYLRTCLYIIIHIMYIV